VPVPTKKNVTDEVKLKLRSILALVIFYLGIWVIAMDIFVEPHGCGECRSCKSKYRPISGIDWALPESVARGAMHERAQ